MVYVEFIIAFTPIFLLFVGVTQLVMLFGARLLVHHATVRAARCAIVTADDDPRWYDDADDTRGVLGGRHATADDVMSALARGRIGLTSGDLGSPQPRRRPSRRADVETSAALVLLPLVARPGDSIGDAIATPGLRESARITLQRLQIDLPSQALERDSQVTVALRYGFECGVPLARRLVCRTGTRELSDAVTLTNQGAGYRYEDRP